jgi:hypothetical protein
MSLAAIGIVLNHSAAVGTSKLVLMGIAWHTGKERLEGCYPSQQTLAEYANCSTRQVRRCLSELVEMEELHMVSNGSHRYGSNASTNLYTIILDCPDWCDKTNNHNFVLDYEADTGDTSSGHPGQVMRTSEAGQADTHDL